MNGSFLLKYTIIVFRRYNYSCSKEKLTSEIVSFILLTSKRSESIVRKAIIWNIIRIVRNKQFQLNSTGYYVFLVTETRIVTRKTIACTNTDYLLHSECRVNYAHQRCACNEIFNYCFKKSIYEEQ